MPAGAAEKSYRVFVEELPSLKAPQTANKSEVKVLTKMGIPIFIQPAKPLAAGTVEGMGLAKGKLAFTVKNTGNVHFLVQSVQVKALDAAGATAFEKNVEGWYVLTGGTRVWEIDIPKEACAKSKTLDRGSAISRGQVQRPHGCACCRLRSVSERAHVLAPDTIPAAALFFAIGRRIVWLALRSLRRTHPGSAPSRRRAWNRLRFSASQSASGLRCQTPGHRVARIGGGAGGLVARCEPGTSALASR